MANWDKFENYYWVNLDNETGDCEVVYLWESIPQFKEDKYMIHVDYLKTKANTAEEALNEAIQCNDNDVEDFYTVEEVEKYLKKRHGIIVNLKNVKMGFA